MAGAPESIFHVSDWKSIQITQQKDNAAYQEYSTAHESLQTKLETTVTKKLKEKSLEESLIVPFEDPLHSSEQKTNYSMQQECDSTTESLIVPFEDPLHSSEQKVNDAVQECDSTTESLIVPFEDSLHSGEQKANDTVQECDSTTENDQYFQESESGLESEESHLLCLQSRRSLQLPSRICHHRTHIMQRPRLPPVPEEPDPPLAPFEEEIEVRSRTIGARLLSMLPTGLQDYMWRIRERHFSAERSALFEDVQTICMKLICSLLIGGIFMVVPYFLINLENESNSSEDSFTSTSDIPPVTFKPDTSVTYSEANITPAMDVLAVNINNLAVDFDT